MTGEVYDEVAARRTAKGAGRGGALRPVDHRTRVDYTSLVAALEDGEQVLRDLEDISAGALLTPLVDIEFTVRRLRSVLELVRAEAAVVDRAAR